MIDGSIDAIERMGDALFNLSDSLRESGLLAESVSCHKRYEAVVAAWGDLVDAIGEATRHAPTLHQGEASNGDR